MAFSSDKSEDLCYLMKRVANQIIRIRGNTSPDYPAAGMGMILSLLAGDREVNQLEMANTLQIRNASLSEAILKLEARGYIFRRKNPLDRRTRLISLTEKGREAEAQIRLERKRTSDAILSPLTEAEQEMLYTLLHKLSVAYIAGRMQPACAQSDSVWEDLGAVEKPGDGRRTSSGRRALPRRSSTPPGPVEDR